MVRRKQGTRKKGKKAKQVRKNRSRRHKSHTKHRSHRLRGGNYADDVTDKEVDGIPVTEDAVITTSAGGPPMSVDEFKRHAEYIDFQGTRT